MKLTIILIVVLSVCVSLPTYAQEKEHTLAEIGYINGDYRSLDGNNEFHFRMDTTFTYKLHKNNPILDGAYETSSCATTNPKTGKVIQKGNFMFYFNQTSCCYQIKEIPLKMLILDRIWAKDYGPNCPNMNLRDITKR